MQSARFNFANLELINLCLAPTVSVVCFFGVGTQNCTYNPHSDCFKSSGVGYKNEDFIVWMRTAGACTFCFRPFHTPLVPSRS